MKKCCISYCLAYSTAVRYGPIIILAYGVKVFGNVLYRAIIYGVGIVILTYSTAYVTGADAL